MVQIRTLQIANELGITNLHGHLLKNGFSRYHATELTQGRLKKFNIRVLYRLCKTFKCTLNDLFEYVPTNEQELQQQSYLQPMVQERQPMDVSSKLRSLDNDKRKRLVEFLERLD